MGFKKISTYHPAGIYAIAGKAVSAPAKILIPIKSGSKKRTG